MTTQSRPEFNLAPWIKWALYAGVVLALFLSVRLLQVLWQYPLTELGSPVMLAHAGVALVASLLTAWMLLAPKGTQIHRRAGRTWAVLLLFIALSSFWLRDGYGAAMGLPLGFGPIHILSVITIVYVVRGVLAIRQGRLASHMASMVGVCWGLLIAGAFTLLPGRFMQELAFFLL